MYIKNCPKCTKEKKKFRWFTLEEYRLNNKHSRELVCISCKTKYVCSITQDLAFFFLMLPCTIAAVFLWRLFSSITSPVLGVVGRLLTINITAFAGIGIDYLTKARMPWSQENAQSSKVSRVLVRYRRLMLCGLLLAIFYMHFM